MVANPRLGMAGTVPEQSIYSVNYVKHHFANNLYTRRKAAELVRRPPHTPERPGPAQGRGARGLGCRGLGLGGLLSDTSPAAWRL